MDTGVRASCMQECISVPKPCVSQDAKVIGLQPLVSASTN